MINAESDIVLYSSRTGKYLEAAPGIPSRELLAMARKGIRLELRSAIRDCVASQHRVERQGLMVDTDDGRTQPLNLMVEPLELEASEALYIVVL